MSFVLHLTEYCADERTIRSMNLRDLSEIRRRLNPDKRFPSLLCGCYVDHIGNPITSFAVPVATLYETENEKYMALFKKVLSGQIGQTLTPIAFPTESDRLLLKIRDTGMRDEEAVQTLFTRLIAGIRAEHPDMQSVEDAQNAENWLILLLQDQLDVRKRDVNGEIDHENSDGSFSYFLCAICPVKQDKPALKYVPSDGMFHERASDWLAGVPAMGFLFPLYEDGAADVNTLLFYSRNINDAHEAFLKAAFNVDAVMPATEQTETFQSLLAQTLGTECSLNVVQEMHEVVSELIEEQQKDKEAEPLMLSKQDVARVLTDGGVSPEKVEAFQDGYDKTFGAGTVLPAVNVVAPKQFKVELPSVSIKVDPKQADILETRVIDGRSYLLIPIEGDIAVNGQPVFAQDK